MSLEVERIYTSALFDDKEELKPFDVVVQLRNGEQFIASFVPYSYLKALFQKHEQRRRFSNGAYFWSKNMVLIREHNLEAVWIVVNNLFEEGEFQWAFEKI